MRGNAINAMALAVALVGSAVAALWQGKPDVDQLDVRRLEGDYKASSKSVVDSQGVSFEVRDYQRIVSLNPVADHILLELVEPERLIAVTKYTLSNHGESWRFGARNSVAAAEDLEALISLKPDLVVTSNLTDAAYVARLQERGILVFDVGDTRGVQTTIDTIAELGTLLNVSERAEKLASGYRGQLEALLGKKAQKDGAAGLFLSIVGDSMYGGTAGSSYGDLLYYGGVEDLAAEHGHRDWPVYSPEELLAMSPGLLITIEGMGQQICTHSALQMLPACGKGGKVLELPGYMANDSGLGLVEAATTLRQLLEE